MSQINESSALIEKDPATGESLGSIPDQLWANVMRKSMENKNLLAQKGALYMGTGNTQTVDTLTEGADGEYERQQIAQTEALNPPHPEGDETTILEGYFLCTSADGLVWRRLKVVVPVTDDDDFWIVSEAGQDESGAYYKEILFSDIGLIANNGNILVQVMKQVGEGWTVVQTPVFITNTSVTVYTDTKFVGKILLFSLD